MRREEKEGLRIITPSLIMKSAYEIILRKVCRRCKGQQFGEGQRGKKLRYPFSKEEGREQMLWVGEESGYREKEDEREGERERVEIQLLNNKGW